MKRERPNMTVGVVTLQSDEVGDGRVDGTAAQRLAIVADLSRRMWALTQQPVPRYSRATIDIWIQPTPDNVERVWRALAAFGAPLADLNIRREDLERADVVGQFGLAPNR